MGVDRKHIRKKKEIPIHAKSETNPGLARGDHRLRRDGRRRRPGQSPVSESQLETFLGLNPGTGLNSGDLTNLGNGPVTSGSAIMQTITVSAGATLTFDYDFLTNAPPAATKLLGAIDPFAFFTPPTLTDFADNYSYPTPMPSAPPQTGFL